MKQNKPCEYRYLVQLKGEAAGKVKPEELKEIGTFDVFGYSGAGLQGQTHLKQDEFKEYLCQKFSLDPKLVKVIDPYQYIGLR